MNNVKTKSHAVKQDSPLHAIMFVVAALLLVGLGLPILNAIANGFNNLPESIEASGPSTTQVIMTQEEWAKLEFAQSCMQSYNDKAYCLPFEAKYSSEELKLDLRNVEIR